MVGRLETLYAFSLLLLGLTTIPPNSGYLYYYLSLSYLVRVHLPLWRVR